MSRPLGLNWLRAVWGKANDIWLGIDTDDRDPSRPAVEGGGVRPMHSDSAKYEAADYRNIRRVVGTLKPGPNDVVYDIGCGKGRCVCVFARQPVLRVVGIDLDAGLCAAARRNALRLRRRRSPIEIRCEDAALADVSDGTIYFLYNPFGVETLRAVFGRVHDSLRLNPRAIRVVYYNAVWEDILAACPWLHRVAEFKTLTNRRVTFWSNRP